MSMDLLVGYGPRAVPLWMQVNKKSGPAQRHIYSGPYEFTHLYMSSPL